MLIFTRQDEADDLYAIWDTATNGFWCDLGREQAVEIIMKYMECGGEYTIRRVEKPQPFGEKHIEILCSGDSENECSD